MRLVARLTDKSQVGILVDSLRNSGFRRDDLIVSDPRLDQQWRNPEEAAREISFIKTERDGLWESESFAEGVKGLQSKDGVLVSVEAPKHDAQKIRELMEQAGAVEIIQD